MPKLHSYKGDQPYIFISYAHKDGDSVYPIIDRMQRDGYRTWFDEGIDPGTEWDETIAQSINQCGYFIAFISGHYMASDNCKDELKYARDLAKKCLLVYLGNVSLTPGMAMRMNRLQSIFKYSDENDFFMKLYEADGIEAFGSAIANSAKSKLSAVTGSIKVKNAASRKPSSSKSSVTVDWSDPANDPVTPEMLNAVFENKRPYLEKNERAIKEEIGNTARRLMEVLQSLSIKTELIGISRGPAVTSFEVSLESETRIRSILSKADDIALRLCVGRIRITPVFTKAAVSIEIPNKLREIVHTREVLESPAFTEATSKLTVALGADMNGAPVFFDVAKMPHLLMGGVTGMGKSVCIHSMLASILCRATPSEVKLILIDPKGTEFDVYKDIPHLHLPVIMDVWKAVAALKWAVTEMDRRFSLFRSSGVRDIRNFNANMEAEALPQILIVIDELADLMAVASNATEEAICRLAQMARAAGIHLILSTQRPSTDVITGLIKSNIPTRIAFAVSSPTDSRTILDATGAEKLFGYGDMLFAPVGVSRPLRVQGAFIRESEVKTIADLSKRRDGEPKYDVEAMGEIAREAETLKPAAKDEWKVAWDDSADPLLRDALLLAVNVGKITTSLLQRNFKLGYSRAAKLIEQMEEKGYVGPANGSKPREVFLTPEQFKKMFAD